MYGKTSKVLPLIFVRNVRSFVNEHLFAQAVKVAFFVH